MPRSSPLSASAPLLLAVALSTLFSLASLASLAACEPSKPADTPEGGEAAAKDKDKDRSEAEPAKEKDAPATEESQGKAGGTQGGAAGPQVDKSLSLDTYEMTPSDCEALGQQYGQVARSDQMSALSPKLSEKQRSATAAQVEKVVSKLEESWTSGCATSLVNKAVDHDAIKCALAAKTVKAFDTCINGAAGTPQPTGGGKKKK